MRTVQRLTQTVLSVAAATLLFVRREAIPGYFGPHNKSFVGLHTPDTDPFWASRQAETAWPRLDTRVHGLFSVKSFGKKSQ